MNLVSDLENLVELDLSLNFLSSVPIGALGQLRNLKFLNLGSNRIQVTSVPLLRAEFPGVALVIY